MKIMDRYQVTSALVFVLLLQGCSHPGLQQQTLRQGDSAPGSSPRLLAVYEPWFGHPRHISVALGTGRGHIFANVNILIVPRWRLENAQVSFNQCRIYLWRTRKPKQ